MKSARERDVHRVALMALLQAMFNAYGSELRKASQMIEDAKSGTIKQPGEGLIDGTITSAATDLKSAIVGYTDNNLNAKYLGSKLFTDVGRIVGDLRLDYDKDTHSKTNLWRVERLSGG